MELDSASNLRESGNRIFSRISAQPADALSLVWRDLEQRTQLSQSRLLTYRIVRSKNQGCFKKLLNLWYIPQKHFFKKVSLYLTSMYMGFPFLN